MSRYLNIILLLFVAQICVAQMPIEKFSKLSSEEIAEETWGKAEKQNQDIPKEWNEPSAVYLNYANTYEITKQSANKANVVQLLHRKVKVLDESSIEYFSEVYFPGRKKETGFERKKTSSGVRLIKKDGSVQNITTDNYILNEDDNTKKLAVPGLEIGDVLEYFIYVVDVHVIYDARSPLLFDHFPIQGDYPVMNFKYSCLLYTSPSPRDRG